MSDETRAELRDMTALEFGESRMAGWDAALAAHEAALAPQWQDIATAPKYDDFLLLWSEGEGVQPGYWNETSDDAFWVAVETATLTGGRMTPTHWMPLPEPPR